MGIVQALKWTTACSICRWCRHIRLWTYPIPFIGGIAASVGISYFCEVSYLCQRMLAKNTLGSGYIGIGYIGFSAITSILASYFWSQMEVFIVNYFGIIIILDLWSIFAWSKCGRYNRNPVYGKKATTAKNVLRPAVKNKKGRIEASAYACRSSRISNLGWNKRTRRGRSKGK